MAAVKPWVLLMLCLGAALASGYEVAQRLQARAEMETAGQREVAESAPAPLLFAKGEALAREGNWQEALHWYGLVDLHQAPQLAEAVRYNVATVYLQQAARRWQQQGVQAYAEVNALLDQAERGYKDVLRQNPEHWDARYNLEYALRIRPPAKEQEKADWHGTKSSVFSTLPGLPGGGP